MEAKAKVKENAPKRYNEFAMESDLYFYKEQGDSEKYCKTCKEVAKKQLGNDPQGLNDLAVSLHESFDYDADAMKYAEKLAKKAAENGKEVGFYLTYASILKTNGKDALAVKSAESALAIAGDDKRAKAKIEKIIQKLKG